MNLLKDSPKIGDLAHGRDNNFNLIRMLAAFGVMVSHAYPLALGPETTEPFETFLKGDNLGRASVFAFFAISGFFITKSFHFKTSFGTFVRARVLRLFPALIVMTVIVAILGGLFISADPDYWTIAPKYVAWIITFQGLVFTGGPKLPGMFADNIYPDAVNGSLWTLRYEVLCYIGVAIAGLLGIFLRPRLFLALAIAYVALYLIVPMYTGRPVITTMLYIGIPFVFGAGFFVFRDQIPLTIWAALLLSVLVVLLRPTILFLPTFMLALAYWVFLLGYANIPALKQYNRLGDYSYGFYIYAFPVQQLGSMLGFTTPLSNILFAFPVTMILSALSWHLLEAPALTLKASRA